MVEWGTVCFHLTEDVRFACDLLAWASCEGIACAHPLLPPTPAASGDTPCSPCSPCSPCPRFGALSLHRALLLPAPGPWVSPAAHPASEQSPPLFKSLNSQVPFGGRLSHCLLRSSVPMTPIVPCTFLSKCKLGREGQRERIW